jgi:hypothetical protein
MTTLNDAREQLRRLCLRFPEAVEVEAWGDPTYRVRNKIFAMEKGYGTEVWCKGAPGAQEAVVAADPERYFVPPYVGSKGWVGVRLDGPIDWDELAELVEDSYRLIAPKRLVEVLDAEGLSPGSA